MLGALSYFIYSDIIQKGMNILAIQSESEITQAVDQLSKTSIELAESTANLGALKVAFGVFLAFVMLMILFFVWQIFTMNRKVQDIHTASVKVQNYFDEATNKRIGKQQANILVRRLFCGLSPTIKYLILRTRLEQTSENKEFTTQRVKSILQNEYAEMAAYLENYTIDNKNLAFILNPEDTNVVIEFVLEQIYVSKEEFSIASMEQATDILLGGIKLDYLKTLS